MNKCAIESLFRISPRLDFDSNCFSRRKQNGTDVHYINGLKPEMNKAGKIRDNFWNNVEKKCTAVYGERSARRQYRNEQGCYVFTWGNKPIYIGLTKGQNGFFQECFAKHKLDKLAEFFADRNYRTQNKTKQNYLHLYLIFWNGKSNKKLSEIVNEMETFLIVETAKVGNLDYLWNISKTNFKWGIGGYHGSESHKCTNGWSKKEKQCLSAFQTLFSK